MAKNLAQSLRKWHKKNQIGENGGERKKNPSANPDLYTNTLRRINVNDTLLGDQLTPFFRANANTMILTFCLARSLF